MSSLKGDGLERASSNLYHKHFKADQSSPGNGNFISTESVKNKRAVCLYTAIGTLFSVDSYTILCTLFKYTKIDGGNRFISRDEFEKLRNRVLPLDWSILFAEKMETGGTMVIIIIVIITKTMIIIIVVIIIFVNMMIIVVVIVTTIKRKSQS